MKGEEEVRTSQSASRRPLHSITLVLAGFLRCSLKAFTAGPPTGCVPKVFLYSTLPAFSSFTNSLRQHPLRRQHRSHTIENMRSCRK